MEISTTPALTVITFLIIGTLIYWVHVLQRYRLCKEISRSIRHLAPAHYLLKVEKFSLISEIEKYESGVFEAEGYNWRLLFPNGDKASGGENHISLYLEIVETDSLPVNVNFKLFVYNQIEDKYLVIQDRANGGVKRFHAGKKIWGFARLLPIRGFKAASNGYIVEDSCAFGAEVFVIKRTGQGESLSLVERGNISNAIFTWKIEKFSGLDRHLYRSKEFTVGGRNWTLNIYPKGDIQSKGKFLSLFLRATDWKSKISRKAAMHAKFKLRVVDQLNGNHTEFQCSYCFSAFGNFGYGCSSLISLENLHNDSNGFIVKDSLTVQVEFLAVSETNYYEGINRNEESEIITKNINP